MASAADTRRSPAAPSPNPSKSARAGLPPSRKTNPVAHEVQVIATGARPGDTDSQRELFTEETTTALVFENGAVIRLSAAVAAGQLLFLTNKESRREVVAQVTRKRDFRPTSCYVEVEFSEPSPGFWGIDFPEGSELVPANAHRQEASELVQTSRTVADKSSPLAPAPSAEEVEALKEEVEALREQLKSMQTPTAAVNPPVPPASAATPTPPPAPAAAARPREDSPKSMAAPAVPPATVSFTSSRAGPPPPVGREATTSFEDNPFPRPEIPTNRKKSPGERSPLPKPAASGSFRPEVVRIAFLSAALLLVAVGAAWYLHWIPWLTPPKKSSAPAASSVPAHPGPVANSKPQKPADAHPDSPKPAQTGGAPTPQPSAASSDASQPAHPEAAKPSAPSVLDPPRARSDAGLPAPAVQQKSVLAPTSAKHPVSRLSDSPSAVAAGPLAEGVAIIPPKLIKSVRAVASPSALQYFDKGNTVTVTLDAFVDPSGHVKSMKVLSGPASLRAAAMKALKQYRYAPARQRGKPVAAHVTVPIKFLFEP